MAILAVLMLMIVAVFTDTDDVWTLGTARRQTTTAGRRALDMITRDLEAAVADSTLTFVVQPDRNTNTTFGFENDELCFVALVQTVSNDVRAAHEICYWVRPMTNAFSGMTNGLSGMTNRYELVRGVRSVTNDIDIGPYETCYGNGNWYKDPPDGQGRPRDCGVVAENVAAFAVGAYGATNGYYHSISHTNRLPRYVDVFLQLLDERAAIRAVDFHGVDYTDHVRRHLRSFSTRVEFPNRERYWHE